ncbi:hypothetical protein AURDEDRAFT_162667 [Auricularia subglabra TFB-10046 SS5]|nr:hypothetical protein AURDEDRAFT_162667 [Auricularia subglabra TFB-10046 SS5]
MPATIWKPAQFCVALVVCRVDCGPMPITTNAHATTFCGRHLRVPVAVVLAVMVNGAMMNQDGSMSTPLKHEQAVWERHAHELLLQAARAEYGQAHRAWDAAELDIGRSLEQPQPSPLWRVSPTSPQTTPRPANPPAAMTRGPMPLCVGTAAANVAPMLPESPIVKLPEPMVVSLLTIRGKGLTSPIVAHVTPAAPRMSPVVDSALTPVPTHIRDELRSLSLRKDLWSTPLLHHRAGGAVRTLPICGPILRTSVTIAKSDALSAAHCSRETRVRLFQSHRPQMLCWHSIRTT